MVKNQSIVSIVVWGLFLMSCTEEKLLSYEDAIKNCKPDTMLMFGKEDTTKILQLSLSCLEGAQLPLFETTMMDGSKLNPDYFEGKISIINFWFIGCKPCEEEMPGFNVLVENIKASQSISWHLRGTNLRI
jgi:thiol-disulfide isomerase/thioredoxin